MVSSMRSVLTLCVHTYVVTVPFAFRFAGSGLRVTLSVGSHRCTTDGRVAATLTNRLRFEVWRKLLYLLTNVTSIPIAFRGNSF